MANKALDFNGVSGFITVPDAAAIQNIFDGGGTIECWINARSDGEGNQGRIFFKRDPGWQLDIRGETASKAKILFYQSFDGTVGHWMTTATEVTINTWAHLILTYDNSNVVNNPILYVNGSLVALTESSTPVGTRSSDSGKDFLIGNNDIDGHTFDGTIDEVRLYTRILGQDEVTANYNSGLGLQRPSNGQNLAAMWHMDESSGTSIVDSSTNGNTGTITGASWVDGFPFEILGIPPNQALDFDGLSGEITIPDAVAIQNIFDKGGTIESLVNIGTNISVNVGSGLLPVKVLEKQTLAAPAASVTFSGIDTLVVAWDAIGGVTSRHLVVIVNAKSPDAVAARFVNLRFNNDVGANYNYQRLYGVGAVPTAAVTTGEAGGISASMPFPGTTYANAFGGGTILIPHAFNTTNHKAVLTFGGAVEERIDIIAGRWASTSAITSIRLSPNAGNFDTGSTLLLGVIDERYLVEEQLLAAPGTIAFNTIPATGHDLVVIGYSQSDAAAVEDEIQHEINGDAHAAAYPAQELTGRAGVAAAAQPNNEIGMTSGDNAGANEFGALLAIYSQYAEGTNQVHYTSLSGYHESTGPTSEVRAMSGRWPNVAAITRLEYYPLAAPNQFLAGTLFSLYRVPRYVIDRQELAATATTITFNNIPQGYQALQLNVYARSDDAIPISDDVDITINADAAAANYDWQYLEGSGVGASTAARNAASQVLMAIPAAGEVANEFGGGIVIFNQYTNIIGHKHFMTLSGTNENQVIIRSSRWENTAAIKNIVLAPVNGTVFEIGSIFELVGMMPNDKVIIDKGLWSLSVGEEAASKVKIKFYHAFSDTGGEWETTSEELDIGTETPIVLTYDNGAVANNPIIYVNGVSVALTEVVTPVGTRTTDVGKDLMIGRAAAGPTTIDAMIEETRLYTRILAQAEVTANYNGGVGRYWPSNMNNLVAWWHMDEGSGLYIYDRTNRGNTGTIVTATWIDGFNFLIQKDVPRR